jgi:hypothetical protein
MIRPRLPCLRKSVPRFLPTFLPAASYPAKFQFVECELLSQSFVDIQTADVVCKQSDQDLQWLAVRSEFGPSRLPAISGSVSLAKSLNI